MKHDRMRKISHGSYSITESEDITDKPERVAITSIKVGTSVEIVVCQWDGAEGLVIH
jgi:hypothetical protein